MRRSLFLTLLLSMTVTMLAAPALASANGVGRIPTVTRLVRIFSELEDNLANAVEERDAQAASKLLGGDFEMRVGAMPGNPIPRAAWIQQSLSEPKSSSVMEQMAVHDLGAIAIVSYSWKVKAEKSEAVRDIFIVDVWKRGADDWELAIRYAAPAGKDDLPVPGAPANAPVFEKKE